MWTQPQNEQNTEEQRSRATSSTVTAEKNDHNLSSVPNQELEAKRENSRESDQCKPYSLSPEAKRETKIKMKSFSKKSSVFCNF